MRVPLTVADFLARGETAFAQSTAVVDDPDQPAAPVPTSSFQELGWTRSVWVQDSGSPLSATTRRGCSSYCMRSPPAAASACR
jgi:hypothetical protein